jgi:hypothetical protein
MGTMFDAVDVAAIPADAEIVAGYVDGNWPTFDALVKAFPNAECVSITVTGKPGARVADCETGDLTPQTAAGWAHSEIAAGRRPCIYYARSNASTLTAALNASGVAIGDVDFWVADWTGQPHLIAGSVATQYADPTTSGGNYDLSETVAGWPVASSSPPAPPQPEEDEVQLYTTNSAGVGFVIAADLTSKKGIPDAADGSELLKSGAYTGVKLTDALINSIPDA